MAPITLCTNIVITTLATLGVSLWITFLISSCFFALEMTQKNARASHLATKKHDYPCTLPLRGSHLQFTVHP